MQANNQIPESEVAAWIGLDWADQKHVICLQASDSTQVETQIIEQSPQCLNLWAAELQQRFGGRKVVIALEQTRGAVVYALMCYDFILLCPIPPASLAAYRKALYPSGAKDDPKDADLLLELLRKHPHRFALWRADTPETRYLQLLVERRRGFVAECTRHGNQLSDLLKSYFPQALDWAGDLNTRQACDFLQRWPTLQAVQKATPASLRRFYQRHGCRRQEVINKRLEQIRQAQPLTRDQAIIESNRLTAQVLAGILRACQEAVEQLTQEIEVQFGKHPDAAIFDSFPGAGQALAPRLLAAFGTDRSRFSSAQQVQQMSGIAPVTESSGKSHWVHWRWACPKFMRQTFHEFAGHSLSRCSWAQAVYQQQRQRGKGHNAAVRVVAFKWMRILFRCWQKRIPYDEEIYLQALRKRNPELFAQLPGSLSPAVEIA
jgi:transposase